VRRCGFAGVANRRRDASVGRRRDEEAAVDERLDAGCVCHVPPLSRRRLVCKDALHQSRRIRRPCDNAVDRRCVSPNASGRPQRGPAARHCLSARYRQRSRSSRRGHRTDTRTPAPLADVSPALRSPSRSRAAPPRSRSCGRGRLGTSATLPSFAILVLMSYAFISRNNFDIFSRGGAHRLDKGGGDSTGIRRGTDLSHADAVQIQ
jgi:hypothetical protein